MALSLNQLFDDFIKEQQVLRNARPSTIDGYVAAFKLLKKYNPEMEVLDLTEGTMKIFLYAHNEQFAEKNGQNLKASSIQTYMGKLNTFFKWLVNKGHIEKNPIAQLPKPKVEYTDKRFINGEDVERIFNTVTYGIDWKNSFLKNRNIAIFQTFLFTGIRRSELLHLRLTDVDLVHRTLFINGDTSKSRRNRHVPIHPSLALTLKTYIQERELRKSKSPYLFLSSTRDGKLSLDGFKHLIEKVKNESKTKFHPHQWRHTFAINLLNQGTDISKLRQLLGHKDITMTAQYLRQIPQKALKENVDSLNFHDML